MHAIWFFCSGICHQLPEHSLHFQGLPLPLCARCSGLFVGFALGLLWCRLLGGARRAGFPRWGTLGVLGLLLLIWVVDGVNSFASMIGSEPWLYDSSNALRLGTGMAAGIALGSVFWPVLQFVLWADADPRPGLQSPLQLLPALLSGALIGAMMWFLPESPYWLWLSFVAGSALLTFVSANGALVILLLGREGTLSRARQAIPYWLFGLLAFVLETGAIAVVRRLMIG